MSEGGITARTQNPDDFKNWKDRAPSTSDMTWPTVRDVLRAIYNPIPGLAAILAIWESLKKVLNKLATYLPRRAALGELAKNSVPCLIFVNHLFTPARDNKYSLSVPDYFPPGTTGLIESRINIPRVIAKSDATAIADILNAMGQVGRDEAIEIVDPVTHWQQWDSAIVCVGGSFKSDEIFRKCKDLPVVLDGANFRVVPENRVISAKNNLDFGLICKTSNPENHRDIWLIIGLGANGTESAGFYLRNNLQMLGLVFGRSPFSIVIRASMTGGGRQASLFWYSTIGTLRRLLHPVACWRFASSRSDH